MWLLELIESEKRATVTLTLIIPTPALTKALSNAGPIPDGDITHYTPTDVRKWTFEVVGE